MVASPAPIVAGLIAFLATFTIQVQLVEADGKPIGLPFFRASIEIQPSPSRERILVGAHADQNASVSLTFEYDPQKDFYLIVRPTPPYLPQYRLLNPQKASKEKVQLKLKRDR